MLSPCFPSARKPATSSSLASSACPFTSGILTNPCSLRSAAASSTTLITVRHEAVEEIGLELGNVEKVFEAYSTPGSVSEKVHFFIATYTPGQRLHPGGGAAHEPEDIEILEMPLHRAIELIREHKILDARTIALVFYLAAQRLAPAAT